MYVQNSNNSAICFNSFGVEHIPKEIKAFINRNSSSASHNKNIKTNIFRIKAYDSIFLDIFVLVSLILCSQQKL